MAEEQGERKSALKLANENVYYCLATLHGEPNPSNEADLLDRNRLEWGRWLDNGRGSPEADDFDQKAAEAIRGDLTSLLRLRMGDATIELPDPSQPVNLADTHFERRLSIGGYRFPAGVTLDGSVLSRGIFAKGANFGGDLSLVSTIIKTRAEFGNAHFEYVTLDRAEVEGALGFGGHVHADFSMREVRVNGRSNFRQMTFGGDTYFSLARLGTTTFFNPVFERPADFSGAAFTGEARFYNAKFVSGAFFQEVVFGANADFYEASFSDGVWFEHTQWRGRVSFLNAKFESGARFRGAKFLPWVPDFRGAVLHEATELDEVLWPAITPSKDTQRANLFAYERLKQEMERLKKHEDEQFFFRKELRVRRALMPVLSLSRLMNFGYDVLSGYGHSVIRPLVGMAALAASGFLALWLLPVSSSGPLQWGSAAQLSLLNLVGFLPMRGEALNSLIAIQLNWIFRAVSAIEALGGGVLLFLLALALKNRFRMR